MATSVIEQTNSPSISPKRTITFAKMPELPAEDVTPSPTSPKMSTTKNQIFDSTGHIRPIKPFHIDIPSSREKVHYYARMYDSALVIDARKGIKEFELFMELHRRATKRLLTHGTRFSWDQEVENINHKNANAIFLRDYDRKWQIFKRGGLTYMCA